MSFTRRSFVAAALASAAASAAPRKLPTLCIFSKHLPKLNYGDLGRVSRDFGFGGVDLTVRPGGHVLPERVTADLPRAVDAIRSAGIDVPMITTGLISPADPAARPTFTAAGKLRVPYFKFGYWRYRSGADPIATVAAVKKDAQALLALSAPNNIAGGFHNHSGDYVGTAVWDTREILTGVDPKHAGYYFDPCHATAEGGLYQWQLATQIALTNLKMVAIKDFYWAKKNGKWTMTMCPLGEGMVDWKKFFAMLAAANFTGPISLHMEYDAKDEHAAIASDLAFMKKQVSAAYAEP